MNKRDGNCPKNTEWVLWIVVWHSCVELRLYAFKQISINTQTLLQAHTPNTAGFEGYSGKCREGTLFFMELFK